MSKSVDSADLFQLGLQYVGRKREREKKWRKKRNVSKADFVSTFHRMHFHNISLFMFFSVDICSFRSFVGAWTNFRLLFAVCQTDMRTRNNVIDLVSLRWLVPTSVMLQISWRIFSLAYHSLHCRLIRKKSAIRSQSRSMISIVQLMVRESTEKEPSWLYEYGAQQRLCIKTFNNP